MSLNNHHVYVAVAKCPAYERDYVNTSVKNLIDFLGGIENYVLPEQKVAVKPNLIAKKSPEEAATTHPLVVEAVVRLVQEAGGNPFIVDSPGGPSNKGLLSAVYRATGMEAVAKRTGCRLNWDMGEIELNHPRGRVVKKLTLLKALAEADVIISLPKLKTHGMTKYTGAVKLMYGAIPGLKKAQYHFNMQKLEEFSQLLIDINTLLPASLNIMDGIIGMEGDGPTAGSPRELGFLLASQSPFALDHICAGLIGLDPAILVFLKLAAEQGLYPPASSIKICGDKLPESIVAFKIPGHKQIDFNLPGPLKKIVGRLQPKPVFNLQACRGCGECQKCCPAQAITMLNNKPLLTLSECIRCYCCQELCPHKAVHIQQHWLGKKLMR
ncbi:DUF362 domain-containing protein [Desulfofarcimen acetoxidans]|uniref:DUF362 domain-containing protein n=1 Tax=Desulfofarcimen acetoxidans TaxID=58138 RepID=UPI00019E6357|nr:DUF362 domain-containing protein [Desulfofarcimen acetoxidans]